MVASVLDGKACAASVELSLKPRIDACTSKGITPHLAVVIVGDDPASHVYVNAKIRACNRLGIKSSHIQLPESTPELELRQVVEELNEDNGIHGILIQSPLPNHMDEEALTDMIDPNKDVDGFHPENVGWLSIGKPRFIPCTPKGIMRIFSHYNIDLNGKDIVVIGRSNIVGRPMSILVSSNNANGTCTLCHSRTKNINDYSRNADIIISAIGVPNFLTSDMIKEDSIIIDVGINRIDLDSEKGYKIVGDANYDSVFHKVSKITPVPGGVGPMTIAMLVENTIEAAENIKL